MTATQHLATPPSQIFAAPHPRECPKPRENGSSTCSGTSYANCDRETFARVPVENTPPGIGVRPSEGAYVSVLEARVSRTGRAVRLGRRSHDCDEVLGARSSPSSALW
ncbi:hypothetical protein [Pseudonocardia yunnanensis]|uniref:Uncharacterized protein n=1 Tax=Pseudonocardia yunnanensis TaxID=58107 RepID=A0ABW4EW76_9PSEU